MLNWFKRMFSARHSAARLLPESRFVVTVNDGGVRCRRPSGEIESVAWDELGAVIVETNDTGPWGTDVLWLLSAAGGSSGCAIPQGATGEQLLLAKLQALPGFDNEQLIAAMCCTENRRFLCWRRAGTS